MASTRARLRLAVRDRAGDGLLYSPPRLFRLYMIPQLNSAAVDVKLRTCSLILQ